MRGPDLREMSQEEKLQRFDAIMREKFGAAWAKEPVDIRSPAEKPETDPKRTMPNRAENMFMLHLMVLRNTLARDMPESEERLKRASPTAWRDARLLFRMVCKVQDDLLSTMPQSREEYYRETARTGIYRMDAKGPIEKTCMRIVTDRYLSAVIEAAMESECIMCMRTGSEVTNCLIRKCLLEQAPPTEVRGDGCEYRKAAGQLIREEEITI